MQISYTYTYIPFFLSLPPLLSSHPTKSSQRTQLGSLCYTETPQQLFYIWKWKWNSLPCVLLLVTPWIMQSMDFSRPEYWSGQPFSSPGDLPNPGIKPRLPTFQADSLPAEPQGKPILHMIVYIYICLCYFLHSFHSLLPRLCPQVHSPYLCLRSFPANGFIITAPSFLFLFFSDLNFHAFYFFCYKYLSSSLTTPHIPESVPNHDSYLPTLTRWDFLAFKFIFNSLITSARLSCFLKVECFMDAVVIVYVIH